jgi:ABC-2 type transport system permease protein
MFELFAAQFKWSWIQYRRYYHEVLGGIFGLTVTFYGLFLSVRYIAGAGFQFGDRLDAIIVGYVLWSLAIFIMGGIPLTVQREAQVGTLEQLFLSPFGSVRIMLFRAISDLVIQLGIIAVILVAIMALTGRWLSVSIALFCPFLTVLMGAYGIAFAIGGLTLLFKTIQQLIGIFNFGLLFILTLPAETWTGWSRVVGYLLPMTPGAGLLRDLMARQQPLNSPLLGAAALNGLIYLAIGISLFRWAERETKRRGKLGGY